MNTSPFLSDTRKLCELIAPRKSQVANSQLSASPPPQPQPPPPQPPPNNRVQIKAWCESARYVAHRHRSD